MQTLFPSLRVLPSMLVLAGCYAHGDGSRPGDGGVARDATRPPVVVDGGPAPAECEAPAELAAPDEIAARLAELLWHDVPDAELLARAAAGELGTADDLAREARRMLADPRAEAGLRRLARAWLQLDRAPREPIEPALRASMEEETMRFVSEHVLRGDASLEQLLLADWSIRDARLAAHHGVAPVPDGAWQRVSIEDEPRRGVLGHASMLALRATPTLRGLFVRSQLLCNDIPPEPPSIDPPPPVDVETTTRRSMYEAAMAEASCQGCHRLMDPIGFGLERFDELGRARTTDRGYPIDDSGTIVWRDGEDAFVGSIELAAWLAASGQVQACVAQRWRELAIGADDPCTVAHVESAFARSGGDLRELLVAIASSPAMLRP